MYEIVIMHGGKAPDAGRFGIEHMMAEQFGWTFEQTRQTPGVVLDEFMHRVQQGAVWQGKRKKLDDQIAKNKGKKR